ncbi:MAG: heat-inducible transcriptional repressor HrcA [Acetobacterales bacterium]
MIHELNERSREIFRLIVDAYVESGEPVGSRTLSRMMNADLSPATIRNVMADLEELGLLYAPHISAGRLPTDKGLRLFVDGLLQNGGDLTAEERRSIDAQCALTGRSIDQVYTEASGVLAGLSSCAGLVLAPKTDAALKHIEFVYLGDERALVVLVTETGMVENRIIELPLGVPAAALREATNYLNARLVGRTLEEALAGVRDELKQYRAQLDEVATRVVEAGLATWAGSQDTRNLIVRGQSKLLEDVTAIEDLERIRKLFSALDTKETMVRLLELSSTADGVQIFIGAESSLFSLAGCSAVVAPFRGGDNIVGAIGVIGPTRIDYGRIIPMVDYTAKLVGRLIGRSGEPSLRLASSND